MIQGTVEIAVGSERFFMKRGDAVVIDPREVHQMWNPGEEDAEYLALGITSDAGGKTVVVHE